MFGNKINRLSYRKTGLMLLSLFLVYSLCSGCISANNTQQLTKEAPRFDQPIEAEALKEPGDSAKQGEKRMLTFDKNIIEKIMREENKYSKDNSESTIFFMSKLDARLQPILDAYLENRSLSSNFTVNKLTIEFIMKKYKIDFWQALIQINRFLDDPAGAEKFATSPYNFFKIM